MWIIHNQFGRRNLPPFARAELALKLEPMIAAKAKENIVTAARKVGRGEKNCRVPDRSSLIGRTSEHLAKIANTSSDTIEKTKRLLNEAPEPVKAALRAGETTINRAAPLFPGLSFARNT
jgi:hypothetical protein